MIKQPETRAGVPLRPDWSAYRSRQDEFDRLMRAAIVVGRSAAAGRHNQPLDDFVPANWQADREFMPILRAASSPASTATAAALATVSSQFLRALVPFSAGAALLASGLQLSFGGAGSLTFPTLAAPSGTGAFIAEGSPIPNYSMTASAGPTLHPCTFAALTSLSSEMLQSAQAEALVRQALLDAAAVALDAALFSNAAEVVGTSPPGLLAGLTPLVASTALGKADAMAEDILALVGAVAPVSGNSPVAIIANAPQAAALRLRTVGTLDAQIFATAALPAKSVLCVATQALVNASDAPRIDARPDVDIHLDTVPVQIGTSGTVASPSYSMFQMDSVSLRLRWPLSWCLRDARAVATVANVVW